MGRAEASPLPRVRAAVSTLLFVGESNPWGGADMALYHLPREASGNRLRAHLGLRDTTYSRIAKTNLVEGPWSLPRARATATRIVNADWRVVVLLGVRVRQAFGDDSPSGFFEFRRLTAALTLILLPHPSGLNRIWPRADSRDRARDLLRRHASWIPWGEVDC